MTLNTKHGLPISVFPIKTLYHIITVFFKNSLDISFKNSNFKCSTPNKKSRFHIEREWKKYLQKFTALILRSIISSIDVPYHRYEPWRRATTETRFIRASIRASNIYRATDWRKRLPMDQRDLASHDVRHRDRKGNRTIGFYR